MGTVEDHARILNLLLQQAVKFTPQLLGRTRTTVCSSHGGTQHGTSEVQGDGRTITVAAMSLEAWNLIQSSTQISSCPMSYQTAKEMLAVTCGGTGDCTCVCGGTGDCTCVWWDW